VHKPPLYFESEDQRRRAVAWVVALAATLPVAAPPDEHPNEAQRSQLGKPTPPAVEAQPETSVYRVLYRSNATRGFSNHELLELLEEVRLFNRTHHVTGMLLYSEGGFVQAIEGPKNVILDLYRRIQQDARHQRVETVGEGPIPARQFAEWSMDFGFAALPKPEQEGSPLVQRAALPGLSTTSAHLKVLMEAFIG
jgi:hypothetical protein